MAEGKKSFLIYSDTIKNIEHLTNEEKGILFQHLLEYVNDLKPVLEDRLILTAWKPIETHLKRDLTKWNEKAPERSDKARKAGIASGKARQLKATKSNLLVQNELKPTKRTVNVSVNVSDNIYNTFVAEVKNGEHAQAIEQWYMRLKIRDGSLTPLLKEFKGQLIIDDTKHPTTLELRKHFNNWLNKQEQVGKLKQYK